jgi:hypothetical protein
MSVFNKTALIIYLGAMIIFATQTYAAWKLVDEYRVADSEEPFERRIYAYDIDLDGDGNPHIIYAVPVPGVNRTEIIYARRINNRWNKVVLEEDGKHGSISVFLRINQESDVVHVCYIRYQNDPSTELVWQVIQNGTPGEKIRLDAGGWHTRMELNLEDNPVFIREGVGSLRLFTKSSEGWIEETITINPGSSSYRLGEFKIDHERAVYHVLYGDGTTYHNLWHASGALSAPWSATPVDQSGTLAEFEFWKALALDSSGSPHVAMYKYASFGGKYNTGTSLLYAHKPRGNDDSWEKTIIAGAGPGSPPDHRAGMGVGMVFDDEGRLHAVWDNSPDFPYDFNGERGNIVYHFPDSAGRFSSGHQVKPYSLEGNARMVSRNNRLFLLALADYVDAGLYFYEADLTDVSTGLSWDKGYDELGVGEWRRSPWFGDYTPMGGGWIFHNRHGFWYVFPDSTPDSIFFWTMDMGWIWTSRTAYSYLYRFDPPGWLYYEPNSEDQTRRWFLNLSNGVWEPRRLR